MLRPATPLSVLLFVAAAMLVISVLSTPIIKGIPLGTFDGVNLGVFGFCKGNKCSKVRIGYDASAALTTSEDSTFDLPPGARTTISSILIVHPVAAFIVTVYFIMAVVAHIHSAFHSSRYLLCLFLMGLIGFIASLLAFLVDVLLFVPHLAWGSYLVLTSTILVAICGIVSCGMRRAMVGRKARRKRVEENNEMNGQNYYNNRSQPAGVADAATSSATTNQQPTVPVLSGAAMGDDSLPGYATYESQKKDDQVSDERIPLTARSPSNRSPNPPQSEMNNMAPDGPYGPPSRSNPAAPPRDPYGNPMGPPDAYGGRPGPGFERMRGRGGMPPGGARGGGGYGPPGRGGYGPGGYGPPPPGPGRAGYGPPGRGYGPPRGGYGPPRGGYGPGGMMRGGRTPPPGGYQGPPGAYDRRGPPADQYGAYQGMDRRSPGPPSAPGGYVSNMSNMVPPVPAPPPSYQAYTPDSGLPRAESPPPLPGEELTRDRPVEMDATPSPINPTHQQYSPLRDSDADVAGMVGLQQARVASPNTASQRHNTYISETSHYSTDDQYVPVRQNWNPNSVEPISPPIPSPQAPFPAAAGRVAAELPDNSASASQAAPLAARADYYEDVDPRFASAPEPAPAPKLPALNIPTASPDEEEISGGARSPAESERSNFTSISQRGINPRWNGGPPNPGFGPNPQIQRRPVPQRRRDDMLLDSNPDFQLPTAASRRAPGTTPNSAYPAPF